MRARNPVAFIRDRTSSGGVTYVLAEWIAKLRCTGLPESTQHAIRLALLDTLGVGLYGLDKPWTSIAADWASEGAPASTRTRATLWGDAQPSLRPADAAFVNGVACHAFELDDYHNAKLHPGAVVIPAALAVAEAHDKNGRELITAIAAGYEVMIRISLALDPSVARLRGWHLTGVCGTFGAAAAAAVLLGLDTQQTAWALGLAGSQSSGLFAFNADGDMSKRFQAGNPSRGGVFAAELAARNFTGPTQVLEAEDGGLLKAFSDETHSEALCDGLGRHYHLEQTSFKPYACCGSLHSYIDAALELRARRGGPPGPGEGVRAGMCRVVDLQCGYDYLPGSELNAQMSARYCLAIALIEGQVLPPQFAARKLDDPAIVALAHRIELVPDPELDAIYPANFVGWVEIGPPGGATERAYWLNPSGATDNPNREQALTGKFRALMADVLTPEAATRIEELVADLSEKPVRALVAALAMPAS